MTFLKKRFGNYRLDWKVGDFWGLSVVVINGVPFAVDQTIMKEISDDKARSERKDF